MPKVRLLVSGAAQGLARHSNARCRSHHRRCNPARFEADAGASGKTFVCVSKTPPLLLRPRPRAVRGSAGRDAAHAASAGGTRNERKVTRLDGSQTLAAVPLLDANMHVVLALDSRLRDVGGLSFVRERICAGARAALQLLGLSFRLHLWPAGHRAHADAAPRPACDAWRPDAGFLARADAVSSPKVAPLSSSPSKVGPARSLITSR